MININIPNRKLTLYEVIKVSNTDRELLLDLYNRLVDDYDNGKAFSQHEEDRLVLDRVINTLTYRDDYITIFCDTEKCLLVFLNDRGDTKVLNFDDNFYSIEEDILAYDELIKKTYLPSEEQKEYLGKFVKYCEEQVKGSGYELNHDYLDHYGIKY